MSYLNWEQYSSLYNDLTESEFTTLDKKAELKLDSVTHLQVKKFMADYPSNPTDFQEQCKMQIESTVANLIRKIKSNEDNDAGSGVASVSNEGFSVSYSKNDVESVENELLFIIRCGLSGTGLQGVQ